MSDGALNLDEEIETAISSVKINYDEQFQTSEGTRTCQDMASSFLNKLSSLDVEAQKVINCFLNELKESIVSKFGLEMWNDGKPNDIIDIANEMCRSHGEKM